MLFLLTLLLGSAISHSGCREGDEDFEALTSSQHNQNLIDALAPFEVAATDVIADPADPGTGEGEDASALFSLPPSATAPTRTVCRFTGMSRRWPHKGADNEEQPAAQGDQGERRLLQRWRRKKGNVGVVVENAEFAPMQKKKRRNRYNCYNDGSITLTLKKPIEFVLATDEDATLADGDPRRELGPKKRESPTESAPYAVVVLTQTNAFADSSDDDDTVVPASFDITLYCKPMYKNENDACVPKGVSCWDGTYTYFYNDSEETEQQSRTKTGVGMKCSDVDGFHDTWDACEYP